MQVLLVEDDELIGRGIVAGLGRLGMQVQQVTGIAAALDWQAQWHADAVIIDRGLPDGDGLQLVAGLRQFQPGLPTLVLTARDSIENTLEGLQAGADDYLVKPFDLRELAARLHAIVRRAHGQVSPWLCAGPLRVDPAGGTVELDGQPVAVPRRELDLLVALARADGRWLSAGQLHERVYGGGDPLNSNALSVHVHQLRKKLGNPAIETSRGLGYRLAWRLQR